MIVRARTKSIENIPAEYLCCETVRRHFAEDPAEVLFIDTATIRMPADKPHCFLCKQKQPPAPVAQILGEPIGNEIILACYDLDEGETSPAEFLATA